MGAVLALLCTGCTQNHGHIGRLFGTWFLYEMTADGNPVDISEHGDAFWSFQGSMIMISTVGDHYSIDKNYGTWVETDTELILDFNHSYEGRPPGTGGYGPPEWLMLPGTDNVVLHYLVKEKNRMALRYNADDGVVYEYFFKKTH